MNISKANEELLKIKAQCRIIESELERRVTRNTVVREAFYQIFQIADRAITQR